MAGFGVGDYVIVSSPGEHTDAAAYQNDTFKITGFTRNLFGRPLVRVEYIDRPGGTVFYPSELSWEDGTRPTEEN